MSRQASDTTAAGKRRPRSDVNASAAQAEMPADAAGAIARRSEVTSEGQHTRWDWVRHWEFWLALGLGAFLRLWHLDLSGFLRDQTEYLTMAREALRIGALPITGLPLSVGLMGQPLDIYLATPFVVTGTNPMPVIASVAVWNVVGIAFCYIWSLRTFGRQVAAAATLLFATCQATVGLSGFLWQPNYIPPLAALWALTLFAGARGKRGWLAPNMVLVALIALLHPTGLLLAPVTLAALALAPVRPRLRDYMLGIGGCVLLALPTIVWEVISGGADLRTLHQLSAQPAHADLRVAYIVYQLLGGSAYSGPDAQSPYPAIDRGTLYVALRPLTGAMELGLTVLFFASFFVLMVRVLARGEWHIRETLASAQGDRPGWWIRLLRRIRADAPWRNELLLWLWITVPLVAMLRHSSPIFMHYLFILYPAVFVLCTLGMRWAVDACMALSRAPAWRARTPTMRLAAIGAPVLMVALVGLLTLGQTAQSVAYMQALAQGRFQALADDGGYGYPVGEVQADERALAALQRQQHATAILISTPLAYYRDELDYLLVGEHPDRTGFYGDCLLLPAPDAGPALAVATSPLGPAAELLSALPNARHLTDIATTGHAPPFRVYRVADALPPLAGELPLTPVTFRSAQGQVLRLESATTEPGGMLRLRWTVLASTQAGQPAPEYSIQVRQAPSAGSASTTVFTGQCAPTRWRAGETLFTWVSPPTGQVPTVDASDLTSANALSVQVHAQVHSLWAPMLGPIRVLTDADAGGPPVLLARSSG